MWSAGRGSAARGGCAGCFTVENTMDEDDVELWTIWWDRAGMHAASLAVLPWGTCFHRVGAPALIRRDSEVWFEDDKYHRVDGPAMASGWCQRGRMHRIEGPAMQDGEWRITGRNWGLGPGSAARGGCAGCCTIKDAMSMPWVTWWNGAEMHTATRKQWMSLPLERLHRIGAPAVVFVRNGDALWWAAGAYHRVDGPACSTNSENGTWYQNGMLHRIDGPANATTWWWLENEVYEARPWERRARRLRWMLHN